MGGGREGRYGPMRRYGPRDGPFVTVEEYLQRRRRRGPTMVLYSSTKENMILIAPRSGNGVFVSIHRRVEAKYAYWEEGDDDERDYEGEGNDWEADEEAWEAEWMDEDMRLAARAAQKAHALLMRVRERMRSLL